MRKWPCLYVTNAPGSHKERVLANQERMTVLTVFDNKQFHYTGEYLKSWFIDWMLSSQLNLRVDSSSECSHHS